MLSDEQITKFQILYKNLFGKDISREEAETKGSKLVRLMQLIYVPITEAEYERVQKRRKQLLNL
jgi:hypothetical protein